MSTRTFADYVASLPTKPNPDGTETALINDAGVVKRASYAGIPVVTELPESGVEGQLFWYDGQMWGFLANGEPWPAKGYKEILLRVLQSSTNAPTYSLVRNDTGVILGNAARHDAGNYSIAISPPLSGTTYAFISTFAGVQEFGTTAPKSLGIATGGLTIRFTTANAGDGVLSDGNGVEIHIINYPPNP